ncbi:hypothetical protein PSTG_17178 [Puccinia striiformis f. sp. tritici PST-78]|uniref:Uncharacterized protein n=1 Tax=Puccinia striiformis f. sp. tritici PST-78 TaxID=1165861 RepID=A0A0L0UQW2_9BASI|nr:hypothetical protein PSTG_17178 [Puccinia striiformis f. sp. tritici PST-78]
MVGVGSNNPFVWCPVVGNVGPTAVQGWGNQAPSRCETWVEARLGVCWGLVGQMVKPTMHVVEDDLNLKAQHCPPSQSAWLLKPRALGWVTVLVARWCTQPAFRQVLGLACPCNSRTWVSDKRSDLLVRADGPTHQPLGQASLTTRRTATSGNCLDKPVRELVGPASPSNQWMPQHVGTHT